MPERNFMELLAARQAKGFHICVGLDTDMQSPKFPPDFHPDYSPNIRQYLFNDCIIQATHDLVAGYKPNSAFYESDIRGGFSTLYATVDRVKCVNPSIPVIVDAKRGDIGNTNKGYVRAIFDGIEADATTIPPYLGSEAMQPFLRRTNNGIYVLCHTSNKGADEFQHFSGSMFVSELKQLLGCDTQTAQCLVDELGLTRISPHSIFLPLYLYVALRVKTAWNVHGNCGLVVGATAAKEIRLVRQLVGPDMQLLIPDVGAQGGNLEASVEAACLGGSRNFVVNMSRSVIFASSGPDFAEATRAEVLRCHEIITNTITKLAVNAG